MPKYGLLRNQQTTSEDIRGAHIYGVGDDKLGKIDDVIFDQSSGDIAYLVVDTGGWLSTNKFLVPAEHLRFGAENDRDLSCDLTKPQIENLPPYNEKDLDSHDKWADYEQRYRSKWETGPVMHRVGTDRNITPTTQQLEGNRSSMEASGEQVEPATQPVDVAAMPVESPTPTVTDSVVISNSAVGIGPRWDTFQDQLRERRKQPVVAGLTSRTQEGEITKKAG